MFRLGSIEILMIIQCTEPLANGKLRTLNKRSPTSNFILYIGKIALSCGLEFSPNYLRLNWITYDCRTLEENLVLQYITL